MEQKKKKKKTKTVAVSAVAWEATADTPTAVLSRTSRPSFVPSTTHSTTTREFYPIDTPQSPNTRLENDPEKSHSLLLPLDHHHPHYPHSFWRRPTTTTDCTGVWRTRLLVWRHSSAEKWCGVWPHAKTWTKKRKAARPREAERERKDTFWRVEA